MKKLVRDNQQNSCMYERDSVFYRYLRIIFHIQTCIGLNFIDGIKSRNASSLNVKRCSFKTVYGTITLILVFAVGGPMLLADKSDRFGSVSKLASYTNVGVMESSAVICRIVMFWKAKTLLKIVRMCCDFEGKEPLTRKQRRLLLMIFVSVILIYFGILINCTIHSFGRMNELSSKYSDWFNSTSSTVLPPFVSTVYFIQYALILTSFITTPAWIIYLCTFFGACYRNLSKKMKELCDSSAHLEVEVKEMKLEIIRSRYSTLCEMVSLTDECLSPDILRLYTTYGIICCVSAYYMVNKGVEIAVKLNYTLYFTVMFLMMIIPALVTTFMDRQAFSLFDELNELFFQMSSRGRQQVATFMMICQAQRPVLTAWNFFDVNLDLIVSISATIITYTVILVQSS